MPTHKVDTILLIVLAVQIATGSQVAKVRISKIGVCGLFNQFNHDIKLNLDERITIMTGPNGFGKTMILRMLNALFTRSVRSLEAMPFRSLSISFDDDSILNVQRSPDERASRKGRGRLILEYKRSATARRSDKFETEGTVSEDDIPFPVDAIDDILSRNFAGLALRNGLMFERTKFWT